MLTLNRLSYDPYGTYGVFLVNKKVVCHSYELPWMGNVRDRSCIPDGSYPCRKVVSPRFGNAFYVDDVPSRSGILIHVGNTAEDTRGCILPGLDVDSRGVLHSRLALNRLYVTLPDKFDFHIRSI